MNSSMNSNNQQSQPTKKPNPPPKKTTADNIELIVAKNIRVLVESVQKQSKDDLESKDQEIKSLKISKNIAKVRFDQQIREKNKEFETMKKKFKDELQEKENTIAALKEIVEVKKMQMKLVLLHLNKKNCRITE